MRVSDADAFGIDVWDMWSGHIDSIKNPSKVTNSCNLGGVS